MATLIPSLGSCVSHMTPGEHQVAQRLEQKLGDDYLLWYDVPVSPAHVQPNFIVLHPRRGLLILEVRDWSLKIIHRADPHYWQLFANRLLTARPNPVQEAQRCAQAVVDVLKRDRQLLAADGQDANPLSFPWSYGVVFPELTRQEFSDAQLGRFIEPRRVLCSDEMLASAEPEDVQSRLWDMFPLMMGGSLSPAQCDRVRWLLFPELRLMQNAAFDEHDKSAAAPELMQVIPLEQERVLRSRTSGEQNIYRPAGSSSP